jgi:formiminoglutamase
MERLLPFTITDLAKVTNHRSGESKFGETMLTVPIGSDAEAFLVSCEARYVLFGIPEDIWRTCKLWASGRCIGVEKRY